MKMQKKIILLFFFTILEFVIQGAHDQYQCHRFFLCSAGISPIVDNAQFVIDVDTVLKSTYNSAMLAQLKKAVYIEQGIRLQAVGLVPAVNYKKRNKQMQESSFLQSETYVINKSILIAAGITPADDYRERKIQVARFLRMQTPIPPEDVPQLISVDALSLKLIEQRNATI